MVDDEKLREIRVKMAQIDRDITDLLQKRAELGLRAGMLKHASGKPVFDPDQERVVLGRLESRGPLSVDALQRIFRVIIDETRKLEDDHVPWD